MNRHASALGIKFVFTTIVILSLFGIINHTSLWILLLFSIIVTGITYLGDAFILPRVGNLIASVADFALIFVLLWFFGNRLIESSTTIFLLSLAGAYLLALCEAIFHIYMKEYVFGEVEEDIGFPSAYPQYQTEITKEIDPRSEVSKNISQQRQTDIDESRDD